MSMAAWSALVERLRIGVSGDLYWEPYLNRLLRDNTLGRLHVAVFVEPYLSYVLQGRKTVESRFSVHRVAPYSRVQRGDVVLLKQSGGPVVGLCRVATAWFYQLDRGSWKAIRTKYARAMCAVDGSFWRSRAEAAFATLMRVERPRPIEDILLMKRDRRGWVVLPSQSVSVRETTP